MKYTAIYVHSLMSGSNRQSLTEMRRVEQNKGETVSDMLERENIADCTVFLFRGHPKMHGEDVTPNIGDME